MQKMKKVEMDDSETDFKFSSSIKGIQISNFEVLDASIAFQYWTKIIDNTHFKRGISLEEQKDQK